MIRHGRRSRRFSVVLAGVLAVHVAALVPAAALAQADTAKTSLAAGDKAAKTKDWAAALSQYEASHEAQPSAEALEGIANAHYQLKQDGEAYAAYKAWLDTYGAKAKKAKKATAEARLKELEARTGPLTINVNEPGAQLMVDDKPMGTAPLAAPLRLAAGPHRVRVSKVGFVAVDLVPNVQAGAGATLEVKLEAATTKGKVLVKEKMGRPIRVVVDGVDMGDAPWSGDLDAGSHEISGKSPTFSAVPEKIQVERGKSLEVVLVASATVAPLKVTTSDGKGLVYLDGKLVGEGSFAGEVPAGGHQLRVTREGYDPYEEELVLVEKQPRSLAVTLKLASTIETQAVKAEERGLEGIYGGFGVLGTFLPGGLGSSMQRECDRATPPPGLVSCSGTGSDIGGGVNGFLGYHWDPVGVELFLGAHYDQSKITREWASPDGGAGIGADPARSEEFTIRRLGGHVAFRMRVTMQSKRVRFTAPLGVGLAYRTMILERRTTLTSDPSVKSGYLPDGQGYLAPVLSFEPAVHYRLGDSLSVGAGISLLLESPNPFGSIPTTALDRTQRLGPNPLTTSPYELARDKQIYIGPFIGMMFGP